jgi:threonine/homoserine/homoserine lactone efflux protein
VTVTHAFLSFALVAGLLTVIPGLDTALVLRTAVADGRRAAFAAASGIGTSSLVWGVAAATGASALLTASRSAYLALRVVGAIYLIWFGAKLLHDALSGKAAPGDTAEPVTGDSDGDRGGEVSVGRARTSAAGRSWVRGVSTNLLNPKVGVFYVAMIPQFIPAGAPHLAMGIGLALVHDAEGMCWFTALILVAHSARRVFARARFRRVMDAVTGCVLLGFGARLATSAR